MHDEYFDDVLLLRSKYILELHVTNNINPVLIIGGIIIIIAVFRTCSNAAMLGFMD